MRMAQFENTIKRSRSATGRESITMTIELIDTYHYIDDMDETEEVKVELRHTAYNRLIAMKKRLPTDMRLSIASWMHDRVKWEEEKEHWKGL